MIYELIWNKDISILCQINLILICQPIYCKEYLYIHSYFKNFSHDSDMKIDRSMRDTH